MTAAPGPSAGPRYTPRELAEMIRLRARPTAEQHNIIAADVSPMEALRYE